MAGSVEGRFDAAVNVVRSMPKKGAYQPSYDTMLKFYALYKQAKEGVCSESKPGFWDVVRKAKWEAWNGLGQMSKQEAMESYVLELKKVMENLPDADEAAEFSEVLKSFYKEVYEGQDEQLPAVLKAFKDDKAPEIIKMIQEDPKSNGYHELHENVQNGYIGLPDKGETDQELSTANVCRKVFPHRDSLQLAGFPHRDSLDLRNKEVHQLNGVQFSNGVNTVLILSPDELKESNEEEDDDTEFQNGTSEVPPLRPSNADLPLSKGKSSAVLTSDESEEDEFCDTLDPEHLQELQNGDHSDGQEFHLDSTLQGVDSTRSSNSNSSPEHVTNSTLTESENSDLETDLKSSQLLTSTPYAKHVTFSMESSDSERPVINADLPEVIPSVGEDSILESNPCLDNRHSSSDGIDVMKDNSITPVDDGDQKPSGILKSHHPVRECGGGDASQQPTGRSHVNRTRQTQTFRNKEGSNGVSGAGQFPRGHRRRGDSDSEDEFTSDHTSGPDYDSAGDEVNDKILQALERLHQDMKNVLRRLGSMEEALLSQQATAPRFEEPWWKSLIPSKPLMFLILWPFIVNVIFYYFRQRKNSQKR